MREVNVRVAGLRTIDLSYFAQARDMRVGAALPCTYFRQFGKIDAGISQSMYNLNHMPAIAGKEMPGWIAYSVTRVWTGPGLEKRAQIKR